MHRRICIALASIALLALVAVACGKPMSPEEKVSDLRSKYAAELNGFVVHSVPVEGMESSDMAGEAPDQDAGAMSDQSSAEAPDGMAAGASDEAAVPTRQDAILDILVSTTSKEHLPGLTVDIEQVDAQKNPKGHWRAYLDTSDVLRGPGTQISYTVEGVNYVDGDGFSVEVRHPVPPAERSEYKEFQESGSAE